jgi:hypothetical protein
MDETGNYICDSCGEEVTVPIEFAHGTSQELVEDCPVCCRPNVIRIEIDNDGEVRVWATCE